MKEPKPIPSNITRPITDDLPKRPQSKVFLAPVGDGNAGIFLGGLKVEV
jgi:hypothetical protein